MAKIVKGDAFSIQNRLVSPISFVDDDGRSFYLKTLDDAMTVLTRNQYSNVLLFGTSVAHFDPSVQPIRYKIDVVSSEDSQLQPKVFDMNKYYAFIDTPKGSYVVPTIVLMYYIMMGYYRFGLYNSFTKSFFIPTLINNYVISNVDAEKIKIEGAKLNFLEDFNEK